MAKYFGEDVWERQFSKRGGYEQRRRGESCTEAAGDPAALQLSGVLFALSLLFSAPGPSRAGIWRMVCGNRLPGYCGNAGKSIRECSLFRSGVSRLFHIAAAVWYTVTHIRRIKMVLVRALFSADGDFFLFTCNCGVNYYRKPFSSYSNLEVRNSSKEELIDLCTTLTETVNQYCEDGVGAAMEREGCQPGRCGGHETAGRTVSTARRLLSGTEAACMVVFLFRSAALRPVFAVYCRGKL